jgi:hypothetical protein
MSIELAEKLKQKLTDKWVVVDGSVPELRRFAQWTGKVKTVNMNCRALVEFDGPEDISWYDIDPAFLTVVDGPRPKVEAKAAAPVAEKKAAPAKPAGVSPLEAARAQGAPKPTAPAAPAGGKPSPLDMIRKQGAAKVGAATATATEAAAAPPPSATPAQAVEATPAPTAESAALTPPPKATPVSPEGKKLSPLELARMQGAAKR